MAKGSRFPLCKDDGGTRDAESRNVPTHYLTKARGQTSRRKGNRRAVCSDKLHARFGGGQGEKAVLRTSLAAYPTQCQPHDWQITTFWPPGRPGGWAGGTQGVIGDNYLLHSIGGQAGRGRRRTLAWPPPREARVRPDPLSNGAVARCVRPVCRGRPGSRWRLAQRLR